MKVMSKVQDTNPIHEIDLSTVYDLMSGCLESYVEVDILGNLISRYRPNKRMDNLDILKILDKEKIDKISTLYRRTSRYGNRHDRPLEANPPSYKELEKDYIQFTEIMNNK
jgi:hypothetical protein